MAVQHVLVKRGNPLRPEDPQKWQVLVGIILLTVLLSGCSSYSRKDYLKELTVFVTDVEKNYESYTAKEWEVKDAELERFDTEKRLLLKEKLTDEDLVEVGKLKAKYLTVRVKAAASTFKNGLHEGLKELEGLFEGIKESIDNK
jgi:hypothetical protein